MNFQVFYFLLILISINVFAQKPCEEEFQKVARGLGFIDSSNYPNNGVDLFETKTPPDFLKNFVNDEKIYSRENDKISFVHGRSLRNGLPFIIINYTKKTIQNSLSTDEYFSFALDKESCQVERLGVGASAFKKDEELGRKVYLGSAEVDVQSCRLEQIDIWPRGTSYYGDSESASKSLRDGVQAICEILDSSADNTVNEESTCKGEIRTPEQDVSGFISDYHSVISTEKLDK